jgi:hypothetical protein
MTLFLDSGALLALERGDRAMWERLKLLSEEGKAPVTHGGVVAQVWRGKGPRQARLARALAATEVRALDDDLGRAVGVLLGRAKRDDVVDAALVQLAIDGDQIATSDPDDMAHLARVKGHRIDLLVI